MDKHAGKAHKPSKTHPWRQQPRAEIVRWAKDKSDQTSVNNYLKGGGKRPNG